MRMNHGYHKKSHHFLLRRYSRIWNEWSDWKFPNPYKWGGGGISGNLTNGGSGINGVTGKFTLQFCNETNRINCFKYKKNDLKIYKLES